MIIEELGLPNRAYLALKRSGVNTVEELVSKSESELLRIRNIGKESVEQINSALEKHGLRLRKNMEGFTPTPNYWHRCSEMFPPVGVNVLCLVVSDCIVEGRQTVGWYICEGRYTKSDTWAIYGLHNEEFFAVVWGWANIPAKKQLMNIALASTYGG